jgi:hypothetical protein
MQLYHGLPVITNKITGEETKGIPHHLLGCIGLEQETWTVGKFVSNALNTVGAHKFGYPGRWLTFQDRRNPKPWQASYSRRRHALLHTIAIV